MTAFVGRDAQLGALTAWLHEAAATGVGRFVLVTGAAGIGKTRLCAEFSQQLVTAGTAVAWSRCWVEEGGGPRSWPWPWPDVLAELERRRGGRAGPGLDVDVRDRFGFFRTVVEELRARCADGPAVVLIDDLHHAGNDVLLLTRFVARSLHRFPLLLVGTWRADDPEPAAAAARRRALAGDATVVEIGPFGSEETAAYLGMSGWPDPTPAEVSRVLAITGGNPMHLAEVVRRDDVGRADRGLATALAGRVAGVPPARQHCWASGRRCR